MDAALDEWTDFNVAMAGATAALVGLVIVASSVNIERIIKAATLTARLGAGISVLVLALVVTGLGLVPEMPLAVYGGFAAAGAVVAGVFQINATRRIFADTSPEAHARTLKAAVGFVPLTAYVVGGLLLVAGVAGGMPVLAAACMLAIVSALLVSWVVLVEVLR